MALCIDSPYLTRKKAIPKNRIAGVNIIWIHPSRQPGYHSLSTLDPRLCVLPFQIVCLLQVFIFDLKTQSQCYRTSYKKATERYWKINSLLKNQLFWNKMAITGIYVIV